MIDLASILGFEWDAGNARKSEDKHGVSQAEAEQVFSNQPLLFFADIAHSDKERRYHAYGRTHSGRLLQLSFTLRQDDTVLRVISIRPMSVKERIRYAEEI
jgi:uncharacterized protein